jgi:predicted lipoprotein with Yx(FWY)xxD motif
MCEESWLPVLASGRQAAPHHWSLIRREKGAAQWAYKGKPLYVSVKDAAPGEAKGHSVEQGWKVAAVRFEDTQLPPGLAAKEINKLGGQVLVNEHGMPLYVHARGAIAEKSACMRGRCANNFAPYEAGLLSQPAGSFTVVERDDGIRQWAYQGQLLYAYDGDIQAGDAKGVLQGKDWSAAVLVRYFIPQDVKVVHTPFGGDTFATAKGETLYVLNIATPNQGRSFRYVNLPNPTVGRALGPAACDVECLKTWRPLRAPAAARPAGFWDIAMRSDGSRQWAYRGFPVYTFAGDKMPGDMNGHDIFAYARADGDHVLPSALSKAEGELPVAAVPRGTRSFIWHAAAP